MVLLVPLLTAGGGGARAELAASEADDKLRSALLTLLRAVAMLSPSSPPLAGASPPTRGLKLTRISSFRLFRQGRLTKLRTTDSAAWRCLKVTKAYSITGSPTRSRNTLIRSRDAETSPVETPTAYLVWP